jgi:hypothetical protein
LCQQHYAQARGLGIRQRIAWYEDVNDAERLAHDPECAPWGCQTDVEAAAGADAGAKAQWSDGALAAHGVHRRWDSN